jgi:hypothetical protein
MGIVNSPIKGHPCQDSFVFEFASEAEARGVFACDANLVLRILEKWGAENAIVRIKGEPDMAIPKATIRLMSEFEPLVQIFFADTSLPPAVLKAAAQKTEEEEGRWGIVRMSDERQVVMSSGMSGVLLSGVGIDETTNWRRPEFWHPEDLEAFNRDWRRQLDTESNGMLEYRYRIRKPGSSDPWEYYSSNYRLLEEGSDLYQVCTFVGRG